MSWSTINAETWDDAFEPEPSRNKGLPSQITWEPALTVLFHPNYDRIGDRAILPELLVGERVEISRVQPDFIAPYEAWGDPLRDAGISRRPFILEGLNRGDVRLDCRQSGTRIEVDGIQVKEPITFQRDQLKQGIVLQMAERIVLLLHLHPPVGEEITDVMGMVGESAGIRRVRAEIQRIADLDVTVFLRGETGTGKEMAAQALHGASPRNERAMVSVNLGALPTGVASASLFGAVRGAYTGAVQQDGYFRAAHKSTLFLDEIGESHPDVQAMLLRVLETRQIYPVGSPSPLPVDVRIVAATDANLETRVDDGSFKAPLLHRLSGYEIWLPPLRERKDDIGRLFLHFVRDELEKMGDEKSALDVSKYRKDPWVPARLMARLSRYHWPGNVRQFRNVVRQLVIGSRGMDKMIIPTAVERLLTGMASGPQIGTGTDQIPLIREKRRKPSSVTERELLDALENNAWNLKQSAMSLGISRASLYALIKKHDGLRTTADLSEAEIRAAFTQHNGNVDEMADSLKVSRHALNRRLFDLGLVDREESMS